MRRKLHSKVEEAVDTLDLNPVMVGARGAAVVDARVRVAPPPSRPLFPALTAA